MTLIDVATPVSLSMEAPRPIATTWLEEVHRLGSVAALRNAFCERYPGLDPARLKRLAIVGAGDEGRRLARLCQEQGIAVLMVCDDNPSKLGSAVGSWIVGPVTSLAAIDRDVPILIASHRPLRSVERLRAMGFTTVALFLALQVIAPNRFPPHMFYDGWLEDLVNNIDRYNKLCACLADDESQCHLDAILGFRMTGDIGAVAPVIDWDLYLPKGLFTLGGDEVYVDGGTYDGDTVRLFMQRVNGAFSRVIAFEPDPITFERLKANFADDPRVEVINKGLYSCTTMLHFANDASRGSILSDTGSIEVPVTSLGEILNGDRVTYIKMNIEGAELEALRGACQSLARWMPKLAISAYHRPTDLWQVPLLIRELEPRYKLYLRQQDAGVIETVVYALCT